MVKRWLFNNTNYTSFYLFFGAASEKNNIIWFVILFTKLKS
jgi:hypothetical protein